MRQLQAPIHSADPLITEWITSYKLSIQHAPATLLCEDTLPTSITELQDLWRDGACVSWLGGPATSAEPWPHRQDRTPLAHIASISLETLIGSTAFGGGDTPSRRPPQTLLPHQGLLEIFHDLESYGYEPEDGTQGAWYIRLVPAHIRPDFENHPQAQERLPAPFFQHLITYEGFTLPAIHDLDLTSNESERYQQALSDYNLSWLTQRCINNPHYEIPTSHIYGHSSRGLSPVSQLLANNLDCQPSDLILLAEFESWVNFPGWFGDAGSLEIWITRQDLAEGRLSRAWCLVRTD